MMTGLFRLRTMGWVWQDLSLHCLDREPRPQGRCQICLGRAKTEKSCPVGERLCGNYLVIEQIALF